MKNSQPDSSFLEKLASPAQRALAAAGIASLEDLSRFTEAEIRELHGIGPNALKVLKSSLDAAQLKFKNGA